MRWGTSTLYCGGRMRSGLNVQKLSKTDTERFGDPVEGDQANAAGLIAFEALQMLVAYLGNLSKTFLGELVTLAELLEAMGKTEADIVHDDAMLPLPRIVDHHA